MLACDFLTIETVWLRRIYVLFFVSLERRRIEFVASTSNPDGRWVAQQARNLLMHLTDREQFFCFLLHDRDSKFGGVFDEVFRSEGMRIIRTPIRAPNANAYAERWVGTFRRECLDRILIVNRRQLEQVLRGYTAHYNEHRRHRSLSLQPPDQQPAAAVPVPAQRIHKTRTTRLAHQRIQRSRMTTTIHNRVPVEFEAVVERIDAGLQLEATVTIDRQQLGTRGDQLGLMLPATVHVRARLTR